MLPVKWWYLHQFIAVFASDQVTFNARSRLSSVCPFVAVMQWSLSSSISSSGGKEVIIPAAFMINGYTHKHLKCSRHEDSLIGSYRRRDVDKLNSTRETNKRREKKAWLAHTFTAFRDTGACCLHQAGPNLAQPLWSSADWANTRQLIINYIQRWLGRIFGTAGSPIILGFKQKTRANSGLGSNLIQKFKSWTKLQNAPATSTNWFVIFANSTINDQHCHCHCHTGVENLSNSASL